ncbi:MAG: CRISPR-associated helicase Cas3', partial [Chloroflexi bacterium]|nr:CRISPR-associated helicase Cas3' [Chloroflexota bacterium]
GKAQFNEDYTRLPGGSTNICDDEKNGQLIVHQWFEGRKKSLLADFVVGTIDQLLMMALRQKHVMLRHLGLAGKIVIIDECHAYDAYMSQYLERTLQWLGIYKVPVIVLSATLPTAMRKRVVHAYLNHTESDYLPEEAWMTSRGYPLITWSDGDEISNHTVIGEERKTAIQISCLSSEALVSVLADKMTEGGCIGLIYNTVKRAQQAARILSEHFGVDTVELIHSRFLAPDRALKEQKILNELGPAGLSGARPPFRIVVGTQVLEQSLNIDFDLLVTELCPMDLLLQRIGRLHRFDFARPPQLQAAQCLILDLDEETFDEGSEYIYGKYLLMRTRALLPETITLPDDIPDLVQDTYSDTNEDDGNASELNNAKENHLQLVERKKQRANGFRLKQPRTADCRESMLGMLEGATSDQNAEATVRDSDESIEIILLHRNALGDLFIGDPAGEAVVIDPARVPESDLAKNMARQRIRLPQVLCSPWKIGNTITELEDINRKSFSAFQQSPWLNGELILVYETHSGSSLNGYRMFYDQKMGLSYEKEDLNDR